MTKVEQLNAVLLEIQSAPNNDPESGHYTGDQCLLAALSVLTQGADADVQQAVTNIVDQWTGLKKWYA